MGLMLAPCFIVKGKFNCTNVCGTIKVNDQHNPYFVSQCLQLVTRKYVSTDLANPKLMNNTMASIEITLPDKETQEFISDLLWCIDEKYSLENELFSRHMDINICFQICLFDLYKINCLKNIVFRLTIGRGNQFPFLIFLSNAVKRFERLFCTSTSGIYIGIDSTSEM